MLCGNVQTMYLDHREIEGHFPISLGHYPMTAGNVLYADHPLLVVSTVKSGHDPVVVWSGPLRPPRAPPRYGHGQDRGMVTTTTPSRYGHDQNHHQGMVTTTTPIEAWSRPRPRLRHGHDHDPHRGMVMTRTTTEAWSRPRPHRGMVMTRTTTEAWSRPQSHCSMVISIPSSFILLCIVYHLFTFLSKNITGQLFKVRSTYSTPPRHVKSLLACPEARRRWY
jgi:hypothetical protein